MDAALPELEPVVPSVSPSAEPSMAASTAHSAAARSDAAEPPAERLASPRAVELDGARPERAPVPSELAVRALARPADAEGIQDAVAALRRSAAARAPQAARLAPSERSIQRRSARGTHRKDAASSGLRPALRWSDAEELTLEPGAASPVARSVESARFQS